MFIANEPFLRELHERWQTHPNQIIIRDPKANKNVTIDELLRAIQSIREEIISTFNEETKSKLDNANEDVFIAVLAEAGYTFVTLFLAVLSLGAVVVPLSPAILPEEAKYFLEQAEAALLIAAPEFEDKIKTIRHVSSVPLFIPRSYKLPAKGSLHLATSPASSLEKGGMLLYTSGTTNLPKGVLHNRKSIYQQCKANSNFDPDGLYLCSSPLHHIAGLSLTLSCLCNLMAVELCQSIFSPDWFWERMKAQDVTIVILFPTTMVKLEEALKVGSTEWTANAYDAAVKGVKKLRRLRVTGMLIPAKTRLFWQDLRGGARLDISYGMTEVFGALLTTDQASEQIREQGCVGSAAPGVEIKIDGIDEGEILAKSPGMFKKYISPDPNIMKGVFNDEGYFKTGDIGRRDGSLIYVLGRASHDVIRFKGWKIYGPEVEDGLQKHPSISGIWVVAVSDELTGQRVAALVSFKDVKCFTLDELRQWLAESQGMNQYKLPTMLRVLKANEQVPMTANGKFAKKKIVEVFFDEASLRNGKIEVHDMDNKANEVAGRPFDWAGIQCA